MIKVADKPAGRNPNWGGRRPGSGRKPKRPSIGSVDAPAPPPVVTVPVAPVAAPGKAPIVTGSEVTAADFLRRVMLDQNADARLRVDAAKALLRIEAAAQTPAGKKALAEQQAKTAEDGTDWQGLLQ